MVCLGAACPRCWWGVFCLGLDLVGHFCCASVTRLDRRVWGGLLLALDCAWKGRFCRWCIAVEVGLATSGQGCAPCGGCEGRLLFVWPSSSAGCHCGWRVPWLRRWWPWLWCAPYQGAVVAGCWATSVLPSVLEDAAPSELVCSMVLQMATMVRSCLQCEASRGSGGGGFFLPVVRLSHWILVETLWHV
jgi:hypothetical protein